MANENRMMRNMGPYGPYFRLIDFFVLGGWIKVGRDAWILGIWAIRIQGIFVVQRYQTSESLIFEAFFGIKKSTLPSCLPHHSCHSFGWWSSDLWGMMTLTSMVLTFLAVNFYKMIFTKEAHERKMQRQMEQTLEATRAADGSIQVWGKLRKARKWWSGRSLWTHIQMDIYQID